MSRPSKFVRRDDNPPRQQPTTHPDDDDGDSIEEEEEVESSSQPLQDAQTPSIQTIASVIAAFMKTSQTNYRSMAEVMWDNEARLREAFEVQFEENARRSLLKGERELALRCVQLAQFVNWKYNMPRHNIKEMTRGNSSITDNFREAVLERFARIAHSVRDSAARSRTSQQNSAPRPTTNTTSDPDRRHTRQTAAPRGAATLVGNREIPSAQPQQLSRNTGDRGPMPPTRRHAPQFSEHRLQDPTVMAPSRQRLALNASTNRPSEPRLKPTNRYSDDDITHPSEPPNLRSANRYSEDNPDIPFDAHDSRLMNQYHKDHVDASHDQMDDHGYLENDNYLKGQSGAYDDGQDPNNYEVQNRIKSSPSMSKPVSKVRAQVGYSNSKIPNTTISGRPATRSPATNPLTADNDEESAADEAEEERPRGEEPPSRASKAKRPTADRAGTLPSDNGNYPYGQRDQTYDTREKPRTGASSGIPYRPAASNRLPSPPQNTPSDPADPRPTSRFERTGNPSAYNEDRLTRPTNKGRPPPRGAPKKETLSQPFP